MVKSKIKLKEEIESHLTTRSELYLDQIKKIRLDISSDTKSSAGDKFETGREMMKQEEQKIAKQQNDLITSLNIIKSLQTKNLMSISKGAFVITNKGTFYISSAIGQVPTSEGPIMLISEQAPIYNLLKGKKKGDEVTFNSNTFIIKDVR